MRLFSIISLFFLLFIQSILSTSVLINYSTPPVISPNVISHRYTPTTLIILGSSKHNVYKSQLANRLIPDFENLSKGHISPLLVFSRQNAVLPPDIEDLLPGSMDFYPSVDFSANVSTIVFSQLGTAEMNLSYIEQLYRFMNTERALIVVEIGDKHIQTRSLLDKGALCWGEAKLNVPSPNTAYLCNDLQVSSLPSLQLDELKSITDPLKIDWSFEQSRPFWPCLFASAASAATRKDLKKQKEREEIIQVKEEVEEKSTKKPKRPQSHEIKDDDFKDMDEGEKLNCKYRKSCYSTGQKAPVEDYNFNIEFHPIEWFLSLGEGTGHVSTDEDMDGDGIPDKEDDDVELKAQKLHCKYRKSCYEQLGVEDKEEDSSKEDDMPSFFSGKLQVVKGEKKTLKDIAKKTVKKVKEAEKKASSLPLPASVIVEKKLNEIEKEQNEKLRCKYRKSCLEGGPVPEIEAWNIPSVFSLFSSEENAEGQVASPEQEVNYDELHELEKKVYCKYRKSCYETGVKPEIDPEINIESFEDIVTLPEIVETRKLTLQEKCKYRKSCYETGILPDLSKKEESAKKEKEYEAPTIVPSSIGQLKNLCKYRKSCYEEVATAESPEIVNEIKERQEEERKEKEPRLRDTIDSPSGANRRLKGTKQRQSARQEKRAPGKEPKEIKKPEKLEKIVEEEAVKQIVEPSKTQKKPKKEEKQPEPEIVPEPEVKPVKSRKIKTKEPEPEPVPEPVKTKKSKAKEPEPEKVPEPEPVKTKKPKTKEPEPEKVAEPEPTPVKEKKSKSKKVPESVVEVEEVKPVQEEPKKEKSKKSGKVKEVPVSEEIPEPTIIEEPPVEKVEKKEKHKKKHKEIKSEPKQEERAELPRDQRLDCKYRKSCYETGEKPVIEAVSWAESFASYSSQNPDGGSQEASKKVDTSKSESAVKLDCKYRKSCYETGEKPVIETESWAESFASYSSQTPDGGSQEASKKVDTSKSESAVKLDCKYRKSCYETGVAPEIRHESVQGKPVERIIEEDAGDQNSKWAKLTKCKYRKTCYQEMGIKDDEDKVTVTEEKRKPVEKVIVEKPQKIEEPKVQKQKSKPKSAEKSEKEEKEQKKSKKPKSSEDKEDEKPKPKPKKEKVEEIPSKIAIDEKELSNEEKLSCKFRKSCYSGVEPKATKEDHAGTMARQQQKEYSGYVSPNSMRPDGSCNIYYFSCRVKMGLSAKEKAPIGPNGRRLCRKKKPEEKSQ